MKERLLRDRPRWYRYGAVVHVRREDDNRWVGRLSGADCCTEGHALYALAARCLGDALTAALLRDWDDALADPDSYASALNEDVA